MKLEEIFKNIKLTELSFLLVIFSVLATYGFSGAIDFPVYKYMGFKDYIDYYLHELIFIVALSLLLSVSSYYAVKNFSKKNLGKSFGLFIFVVLEFIIISSTVAFSNSNADYNAIIKNPWNQLFFLSVIICLTTSFIASVILKNWLSIKSKTIIAVIIPVIFISFFSGRAEGIVATNQEKEINIKTVKLSSGEILENMLLLKILSSYVLIKDISTNKIIAFNKGDVVYIK